MACLALKRKKFLQDPPGALSLEVAVGLGLVKGSCDGGGLDEGKGLALEAREGGPRDRFLSPGMEWHMCEDR